MSARLEALVAEGISQLEASDRLAEPIPRIHPEEIKQGRELGKGAYGRVYAATIDSNRWHVPLAVKVYENLEELIGKIPPLLNFISRGLIMANDAPNRNNPHLILPLAYAFGPDSLLILQERMDTSLEEWAASQKDIPLMKDFFVQMAQGLALLHEAGWSHRDIKPRNYLVRDNEVKLSDFLDTPGLPSSLTVAGPSTTWFADRDGFFGSRSYIPPEILAGYTSVKDVAGARWDMVAFGLTLAELGLGIPPASGLGPDTVAHEQYSLIARPDLESLADSRGFPGLERVIISSILPEEMGGYSSSEQILPDLNEIVGGTGTSMRHSTQHRKAWRNRHRAEELKATEKERRIKRSIWKKAAGIGAAVLCSYTLLHDMYLLTDWKRDVIIEQAKGSATDGLTATEAASLFTSFGDGFATDLEHEYLPELHKGTRMIIPVGSISHDSKPVYYLNRESPFIEFTLHRLFLHYKEDNDRKWLDAYNEYAREARLEIEDPVYSDTMVRAVGRFSTPLLHIEQLSAEELPLPEFRGTVKAAAALGLRQYNARVGVFYSPMSTPQQITALQEDLMPRMLTTILGSSAIDEILDTSNFDYKATPVPPKVQGLLESLEPLQLHDLYDAIAQSGVVACNTLLGNDGRAFYSAPIDEHGNLSGHPAMNGSEPGGDLPSYEQPVPAQLQTIFLKAQARRIAALRKAVAGRHEPRLRDELGNDYDSFMESLDKRRAALESCARHAEEFYLAHLDPETLMPAEYLTIPTALKSRLVDLGDFPLDQDPFAAVNYIRAQHILGNDDQATLHLEHLLAYGTFNAKTPPPDLYFLNAPEYPTLTTGMLIGRIVRHGWVGTSVEADTRFEEALLQRAKQK